MRLVEKMLLFPIINEETESQTEMDLGWHSRAWWILNSGSLLLRGWSSKQARTKTDMVEESNKQAYYHAEQGRTLTNKELQSDIEAPG